MNPPLPYVNHGFSVAFLERVFGAEIVEKHGRSSAAFRVEGRIGDSTIVLEASNPPHPSAVPAPP